MKDLRARIEALPRTWIGDQPKLEQAFVVLADVLACLDAATPALPAPSTRPGGMRPTDGPRHTWRFERDDKGFTVTPSEAQAVESSTAEPPKPLSNLCPHGWPAMMHCCQCYPSGAVAESPEAADQDRANMRAFEAWAREYLPDVSLRRSTTPNCYFYPAADAAWLVWNYLSPAASGNTATARSDKPQVETGTGAPLLSDEQIDKLIRGSDPIGLLVIQPYLREVIRAVIAAHQQPK